MSHPKLVFDVEEVAHLWAHRKAAEGRNRTGNFYFTGDTIYSYGSHFPIAKLVRRGNKDIVLFTTREFSNMTTQHKYKVLRACSHLQVIKVPDVHANSRQILAYHKDTCNELLTAARKRRSGCVMNDDLVQVERVIESFNLYAKLFGLVARMAKPKDWKELWTRSLELKSTFETQSQERLKKKAEERERIAKLLQQEFDKVLPEWEAGRLTTHQLPRHEEIYLRKRKNFIETSRGALFPFDSGRVVFELIMTARNNRSVINDVDYQKPAGDNIRHYAIEQIDADGAVHSGCHHIKWPQIERFARRIGWMDHYESERKTESAAA